jgi:DNA-binding transcriptional ArsR family regulator
MDMSAKRISEVDPRKLKRFLDRKIIKALSHDVREHILAVLNERIASPNEIADELEVDVSFLDYHFEVLLNLGSAEIVDVKPRRGANEHFYRATATLVFDNKAWAALPDSVKADIAAGDLNAILNEAAAASLAGTLNADDDRHLSWTQGVYDDLGRKQAMKILDRALELLAGVQRESGERVALSGEPGIPVTIALMGFRAAPGATAASS